MKKITAVLLSVLISALLFTACSASDDTQTTTSADTLTTASDDSGSDTSGASDVDVTYADSDKDISEASLTESEAVDKVKALSAEQLGLEGSKDDYKFMVGTVGKLIDGKDYIEVIAAFVSEENEDGTVDIDTKGTYYISYDGEELLIKDSSTGELREIEQ